MDHFIVRKSHKTGRAAVAHACGGRHRRLCPERRGNRVGVYLGIDIGGTKTALALYDRHFQTAAETAMPTQPERGCRDLVCRIAETANGMLQRLDAAERSLLAAGVACPARWI